MGIKEEQKKLVIGIVAAIAIIAVFYIVTREPYDKGELITTDSGDEYDVTEYVDPATVPEPIPESAVFDFETSLTMQDCNALEGEPRDSCISDVVKASANYEDCGLIEDRDREDLCLHEIAYNTNNATPCSMAVFGVSDCYYDLALKTNDAALCEYTEYEEQKCLEAFNARDIDLCEETGNERVYCNFAVLKNWPELCGMRRARCIASEKKAEIEDCVREGDQRIADCRREGKKSSEECLLEGIESTECLYNEMENNPDLCTGMPGLKSACYRAIAIETENPSLCDNADVLRGECYYKLALDTDNAALCSKVGELKDYCFAWVAYNTANPAICNQAGTEREACLADIAELS